MSPPQSHSAAARRLVAVCAVLGTVAALLVAVPPAPAAAQTGFEISIAPEEEADTAVRAGQEIAVSGQAPVGEITSAELVGYEHTGGTVSQQITALNNTDEGDNDFLRNDEGELSGRITPGCRFDDPAGQFDPCSDGVAEAELRITVDGATGASNRLRVDYVNPRVAFYQFVDTHRVRVVFTEPVRHPQPDQEEFRATRDFSVEDEDGSLIPLEEEPITGLDGPFEGDCTVTGQDDSWSDTGCTRTLHLADIVGELDEDATPQVFYDPDLVLGDLYHDFASNPLHRGGTQPEGAVNLIRPPLPSIDELAGKAPDGDDRVVANQTAPQITVSNLRDGHEVFFDLRGPGIDTTTDPVTADGDTLTTTIPDLGDDGEHTIEAVVRDPHGNESRESDKNAARDDASPSVVTYQLDTVAPTILAAEEFRDGEILVTMSEPVVPDGDAGEWTVDGEAVTAQSHDDPDKRILDPGFDIDDGTLVSWEPAANDDTYHDEAGNELEPRSDIPLAALPTLPEITVTEPDAETYTDEGEIRIAGTAPSEASGQTVQIRDTEEGTVAATTTVAGDGSWAVDVSLSEDGRYFFAARLVDLDDGRTGPLAGVPDVIRDTVGAEVDVHEPSERDLTEPPLIDLGDPLDRRRQFAVGDPLAIEWTASDDASEEGRGDDVNPDHGDTVDVFLDYADAGERVVAEGLDHRPDEQRSRIHTVTEDDLDGQSQREVRGRVEVTDLAGNVGEDTSDAALLVADLVGYTPALVDAGAPVEPAAARIEARFATDLDGSTIGAHWEVDGTRALDAEKTTRDGDTVVVITPAQGIDEDATPDVRYAPGELVQPPDRLRDGEREVRTTALPALNEVRPPLPEITAVAGASPEGDDRVVANDPAPEVDVDNLRDGHTVVVEIDGPGVSMTTAPVTASGETATVTLPDLADDGNHTLEAVVRDPHGNESRETDKNAARDDAAPSVVTYRLDTVRPRILTAEEIAAREILVTISEPVFPDGDAGTWTVDGEPVTASQPDGIAQNQRVLEPDFAVDDGSVVSWEPDGDDTYADAAGNELVPRTIGLVALPPLPTPNVTQPNAETYTAADAVRVAGRVASAHAGRRIDIIDRDEDEVAGTGIVAGNGSWSVDVDLEEDGRYRFGARLTDPDDGRTSETAATPDVIRDTVDPDVEVHEPSERDLTEPPLIDLGDPLDRRRQFAVGDPLAIEWTASDDASEEGRGDDENPDHGDTVDVTLAFADGATRTLASGLDHSPDERRTYTHTVTEADLGDASDREVRGHVAVTDLAGNVGEDTSDAAVLVGGVVGYTPAFVATGGAGQARLVMRFPIELEGSTSGPDWEIDGTEALEAEMRTEGGRTVVVVTPTQAITDPNATPDVRYDGRTVVGGDLVLAPDRLRDGDREVRDTTLPAVNEISPILTDLDLPAVGPRNIAPDFRVPVSGRTDETARPNTIRVRQLRSGGPVTVAQTRASEDGRFSLSVPVVPNADTEFDMIAVDPFGNTSRRVTFEVIEDSIAPRIVITSPEPRSAREGEVPIRWETEDRHPETVDIQYRRVGGAWTPIRNRAPDTGAFDWTPPASLDGVAFDVRIRGTDQAGNTGPYAVVAGVGDPVDEPDLPDPEVPDDPDMPDDPDERVPDPRVDCDNIDPAPFVDRDEIHPAHRDSVDCLWHLGLTVGTFVDGERHFLPRDNVIRGQFSEFVARVLRAAHVELPEHDGPRFTDVPEGFAFDRSIHQLAAAEIIGGYGDGRFGPADDVRRDQTATFLIEGARFATGAALAAEQPGTHFADTAASVHRGSIDAAFEHGLVRGRTAPADGAPGIYEPASSTSRQQMASVLINALQFLADR